MDQRPYYLQKAREVAALAARFEGVTRTTLLSAAHAWMVLFEAEDQRLKNPLPPGLDAPSRRSAHRRDGSADVPSPSAYAHDADPH